MDDFRQMRLDSHKQEEVDKFKYANGMSYHTLQRVEQIRHTFTNSLISIGINPEGKDLLEIIAAIADELNKNMCELQNLKVEMYNEIDNLKRR